MAHPKSQAGKELPPDPWFCHSTLAAYFLSYSDIFKKIFLVELLYVSEPKSISNFLLRMFHVPRNELLAENWNGNMWSLPPTSMLSVTIEQTYKHKL